MKYKKIVLSLLVLVSILITPFSSFASTIPQSPALFETSLSFPIAITDTSMTLQSTTLLGGASLPSGYSCFTVDQGLPNTEYICGTVSGQVVSSLIRGIDPLTGNTSDSNLIFSHRRGADVKITDFPVLTLLRNILNGQDTLPGPITYAPSITPINGQDLATKTYVLSIVGGGTTTLGSLITDGIAGETLSAGNFIYLKSSDTRWYKTDSSISTTTKNVLLGIAQSAGTVGNAISSGVLLLGVDSHQSNLSSGSIYYASTTPGALGTTATTSAVAGVAKSSTSLYFNTYFHIATTSAPVIQVFTASSTWTKPANLKYIVVEAVGGGGGSGGATDVNRFGGSGGGGAYCKKTIATESLGATETVVVGAGGTAGGATAAAGNAATSTFGSFCTAGGGRGGTSNITFADFPPAFGGVASGGDLNLNGQSAGMAWVNTTDDFGASGIGGSSMLGEGAFGIACSTSLVGMTGNLYGGGAAGACSANNTADILGAVGSNGAVIVSQYFQ